MCCGSSKCKLESSKQSTDRKLSKICYTAEIDIENKTIGATIAKEWNIKIVPTIIVLENGKEVKRFEPGISMKFNEDVIIESIRKEVK